MSLLVQECGLKPVHKGDELRQRGSLLVQECGLKLCLIWYYPFLRAVTPCTGVWIETL